MTTRYLTRLAAVLAACACMSGVARAEAFCGSGLVKYFGVGATASSTVLDFSFAIDESISPRGNNVGLYGGARFPASINVLSLPETSSAIQAEKNMAMYREIKDLIYKAFLSGTPIAVWRKGSEASCSQIYPHDLIIKNCSNSADCAVGS